MILPGMAVMSELIATFSRSESLVIPSWHFLLLIALISFLVWGTIFPYPAKVHWRVRYFHF